jgi:hypothetical protein
MSDDRPNLYLSMLADFMKVGVKTTRKVDDFQISKAMPSKNKYFDTDLIVGLDDNAVHPQWMGFIINVTAARNKASSSSSSSVTKNVDATNSNTTATITKDVQEKILKVIQQLSKVSVGDRSFEEVMVDVVKHLIKEIKDDKGISLNSNHSTWGNAKNFEFNDDLHQKLSKGLTITLVKVLNITDAINQSLSLKATQLIATSPTLPVCNEIFNNIIELLKGLNGGSDGILPKHILSWKSTGGQIQNSDYYDGSTSKTWGDLNSHMKTDAISGAKPSETVQIVSAFLQKLATDKNRKYFGFKWTLYLVKMLLKDAA